MKGVIEMKKWGDQDNRGKRGWLSAVVLAITLLFVGWFFYANQPATLPVTPPVTSVAPVVPSVSPVTEEKPPAPEEPPAVEIPPVEEPTPEEPLTVEAPPVKEEPPAPSVPEIPSNFIVPDEVWENASLLVSADGTPLPGVVWFSEIPIGTRLYSPIDGSISIMEINLKEGGTLFGIILSTSPDRGYQSLNFLLRKATLLTIEPKTGEAFAVIEDASPFQTLLEKEVALEVAISPSLWESNSSITDPKTYFWSVVQAIKPVK